MSSQVQTHALDVVTILDCLRELEESFLGDGREWNAQNDQQKLVFRWYTELKHLLPRVTGIKAKGSRFYGELNQFLTQDGFDPMFDPFDSETEIGVASILDKLVNWVGGTAALVDIHARNKRTYPGFEIEPEEVNIYRVSQGDLVQIFTKSEEDTLWLLLPEDTIRVSGLGMVQMVMNSMGERTSVFPDLSYVGVQIPKVDFDVKPNLDFMLGACISNSEVPEKRWVISQAFQQFKFRMNEEGARAKVATGMVMRGIIAQVTQKLVFNRPFYGWFAQKGLGQLPMAVFYAGYDSWREPAGSLEEL